MAIYDPGDLSIQFADPGQRFLQGVMVARQKQEAQAMKAAMQDYMSAPTPQKLAELHLRFPALKEQLNAYQQTLSDADARMTRDFASQAFALNRAGRPDEVLALYDQRIEAAKNSNRPDMVQALQASRRGYELIDDPTQREAVLGSLMAGTGKEGMDLFEKLFSTNLDLNTTTVKELVAEGLKPGTPEFQDALRKKREGDPFIVVPGVGLYLKKDVMKAADTDQVTPNIPQAAVNFLKANPALRSEFDKKYGKGSADRILGGGGSNATGSFRGR